MAEEGILSLGPRNTSLLVLQEKQVHVSSQVWNDETKNRILKLRKPGDSRVGIPWQIENLVRQAGFYEVAMVNSNISLDKALISALVERWRPETHSFHMPFGECTITLQDVALQLGLNIDGRAVTGVTWCDWSALIHELLGKIPPANVLKGGTLRISWLTSAFKYDQLDVDNEIQVTQYARAYLLQLIGSFLLNDHSGSNVPLKFLPLLTDLEQTSTYSWGSAVLATLYHELCYATDHGRVEIGGCLLLIQLWAWERIRKFTPVLVDGIPQLQPNLPIAARWLGAVPYEKREITFYRGQLDKLRTTGFVWMPYADHVIQQLPDICRNNDDLWRSVVPMICFHLVEWHQPDRVMQQFGMQQPIPDPPSQQDEVHDISMAGKEGWDWPQVMKHYIRMWAQRRNRVVEQPPFTRLAARSDDYMMWYSEHSIRWLTREAATIGQAAERIHVVWYGLGREGQGLYTRSQLRKQLERCLALLDEHDRITVPRASVAPVSVEISRPTRGDLPTLRGEQGQGLARRRTAVASQQVPIVDYPDPLPVGDYGLYAPYAGPSHVTYHVGGGSSGTPSMYQGDCSSQNPMQVPESQPVNPSYPMQYGSQPYGMSQGPDHNFATPIPHSNPLDWPSPLNQVFLDVPHVHNPNPNPDQYHVDSEQIHNTQGTFDLNMNEANHGHDGNGNRVHLHRDARNNPWPRCGTH